MKIEEEEAKLRKKIENFGYQLNSGQAISEKEDQVDYLRDQLQNLEKKLTSQKLTKMNVKLHFPY